MDSTEEKQIQYLKNFVLHRLEKYKNNVQRTLNNRRIQRKWYVFKDYRP